MNRLNQTFCAACLSLLIQANLQAASNNRISTITDRPCQDKSGLTSAPSQEACLRNDDERMIECLAYGQLFLDTTLITPTSQFDNAIQVKAFPEPGTNNVTVEFENPDKATWITFTDVEGKEVKRLKSSATVEKIDVGSFPAGTYILSVESLTYRPRSFKMVKSQ